MCQRLFNIHNDVVAFFYVPEVLVRLASTQVVGFCFPSSSITDPVSLPSPPPVSTPTTPSPLPSHSRQISLYAVLPSQSRSSSSSSSSTFYYERIRFLPLSSYIYALNTYVTWVNPYKSHLLSSCICML